MKCAKEPKTLPTEGDLGNVHLSPLDFKQGYGFFAAETWRGFGVGALRRSGGSDGGHSAMIRGWVRPAGICVITSRVFRERGNTGWRAD